MNVSTCRHSLPAHHLFYSVASSSPWLRAFLAAQTRWGTNFASFASCMKMSVSPGAQLANSLRNATMNSCCGTHACSTHALGPFRAVCSRAPIFVSTSNTSHTPCESRCASLHDRWAAAPRPADLESHRPRDPCSLVSPCCQQDAKDAVRYHWRVEPHCTPRSCLGTQAEPGGRVATDPALLCSPSRGGPRVAFGPPRRGVASCTAPRASRPAPTAVRATSRTRRRDNRSRDASTRLWHHNC